jgi:hypothetical protein
VKGRGKREGRRSEKEKERRERSSIYKESGSIDCVMMPAAKLEEMHWHSNSTPEYPTLLSTTNSVVRQLKTTHPSNKWRHRTVMWAPGKGYNMFPASGTSKI